MILGFVLRPNKKLEKRMWEDSFTNYSQLRARAKRQYMQPLPRSSKQWLDLRLALCVAGRSDQTDPGTVAALLGRFHAGTHAAYTDERLLALPQRVFADAEPRVGLGVASSRLFMHWAQFEGSWRSPRPRRHRRARNGSCTMPVALHLSGFGTHPLRSLVLDVLEPPVTPAAAAAAAAQRVLVVSPDWPAAFMREQAAFEVLI